MLALSITALMLLIMLAGAPVAVAMGVAGSIGLYLVGGADVLFGILETTPHSSIVSYELIAIPMFILMAEFAVASGVADDLFNAIKIWVGRMRGGLAVSTAIAGAVFAAICGSSSASAATLSAASIPAMVRNDYKPDLAYGLVAITGTLAMLIPPSIAIILFGIIADESIAQLLIAGIIPGGIVLVTIIATVYFMMWLQPDSVPVSEPSMMAEKVAAFKAAGPFLLLFFAVTGLIYLGVATPTESAAIGAVGALFLAVIKGKSSFSSLYGAVLKAASTSAMILMIIIGAHIFTYFLTLTQSTQNFVQFIVAMDVDSWIIILMIFVVYLILGCFMDQVAILILTVPLFLPVVVELGYSPIWFGIMAIVIAEVGMVTPPVGINSFVVAKYANVPVQRVFVGVTPHVIAHMLVIALLSFFPALITWLPSTMDR